MRRNIVIGNWKMNLDIKEASTLVDNVLDKLPLDNSTEIVFAPAFVYLSHIVDKCLNSDYISVAAQDCSINQVGAYTGEVSASMISSCSVNYVIIGHSERRSYFNESNMMLREKVNQAINCNLTVVFCCGENLDQRQSGNYFEWIELQLTESLFHLSSEDFLNIVIAYEPIWAIGTGVTANSKQAQEVHSFIRQLIERRYGYAVANKTLILYGGSCKSTNAKELFSQEDIDGGLIGGASLDSSNFVAITQSF